MKLVVDANVLLAAVLGSRARAVPELDYNRTMRFVFGSRFGFGLRGSASLIVAIAVVAILLIMLPAYRWFFLISVLIGLAIAGSLTFWYKRHPIKDEDVHPKRPLGL